MATQGHLLSGWSSFEDAGKEAMAMKQPEPVGDSLPLDIHVIIKKASGGIGGVQVTKPSSDSAGIVAGAPVPKAAMSLLVPRCPMPERGTRGRWRKLSQFL
mmetsp:Transcript_1699/g.2971  ORF Transcript_1699/g.2971 Transcript_1699/m.2971 type:complete len:101 (-) Transcript_1699:117-419(-)